MEQELLYYFVAFTAKEGHARYMVNGTCSFKNLSVYQDFMDFVYMHRPGATDLIILGFSPLTKEQFESWNPEP